jgi:hypothetical protein
MDREHRAAELMIPRYEVPQPVGQREHPLVHLHGGHDRVHEVRGALGHPPSPATRAEPPALAGEREQVLKRTTLAAHPRKAVGQHPAGQELKKLARDELGQAGAVGPVGGRAQKDIKVVPPAAGSTSQEGRVGLASFQCPQVIVVAEEIGGFWILGDPRLLKLITNGARLHG